MSSSLQMWSPLTQLTNLDLDHFKSGCSYCGWTWACDGSCRSKAVITVTTEDGGSTASCVVTVGVYDNDSDESGGDPQIGGSNPVVPTTPSTGVKNGDGSTTTSITDQTTGTVTETTVWPNGDREVITKERNGTITEVVTKQNGSKRYAIDWAVSAGILNGKPGNLLDPAGAVSRAELSAMLARFIAWRSN